MKAKNILPFLILSFFTILLATACDQRVPILAEEETFNAAQSKTTAEAVSADTIEASIAPTPTLPHPTTVHVFGDGSGEFVTLGAAVESVAAESTIILGEGTFQLDESLEINKPLTLEGAGSDKTIVIGMGGGTIVKYTGEGLFTMRDITFRREGDFAATVMAVLGGEVDFSNCGFANGATSEDETVPGMGLIFFNDAVGIVRNCAVEDNAQVGILVRDEAHISLENNTCSFNNIGIAYVGNASGIVKNNQCANNLEQGILVSGLAKPELTSNDIHDNGSAGITFSLDENGGVVQQNDLQGNNTASSLDSGTDIFVSGAYSPDFISNTCSREGLLRLGSSDLGDHSGIVFASRDNLPTGITIEGNSCAVVWCSTPTGSFLNMNCSSHR